MYLKQKKSQVLKIVQVVKNYYNNYKIFNACSSIDNNTVINKIAINKQIFSANISGMFEQLSNNDISLK